MKKEPPIVEELKKIFDTHNTLKRSIREYETHLKTILKNESSEVLADSLETFDLHLVLLQKSLKDITAVKNKFFDTVYVTKAEIDMSKGYLIKAHTNCTKILRLSKKIQNLLDSEKIYIYSIQNKIILKFVLIKKYFSMNDFYISTFIHLSHTKYLLYLHENGFSKDLDLKKLKKGDLILSYKSKEYIKTHLISRIIAHVEGSQITHSSIITKTKPKLKMITASGIENEILEEELKILDGETLIIFRPITNHKQRLELETSVDYWTNQINNNKIKKFSYLKFYFALFSGLIYKLSGDILHHIIVIPNPFNQNSRYFCSELINKIFVDAKIYLTYKSHFQGLIGPYEFIWSDKLKFIGALEKVDLDE